MQNAVRLFFLMLSVTVAATASAGAQPAATDAASAGNPPENELVTNRVTQEFLAWQHGKIDRKHYTGPAGGTYDDSVVGVISPDLKAIGPVQSARYRTTSLLLGDLCYRYDITGSAGTISVLYVLDQSGRVDGIAFTPQIFRPDKSPTP